MRFEHRAVPIVLAAVLIDTIGFGIVMPVLPTLIVQLKGGSLSDAARTGGALLIAFAAAQFVAGPIFGSLGDRFGRRPVLLAAMIAFAVDYALMAFAPTVGWLFLGRVVAGVAGAIYGPANAVLADVTPAEKRGEVFGLMGAAFGAGFIIGPAIGGLLVGFGPRAPFVVAGALAVLNAIWMAVAMPETLAPADRRAFDWRRANAFGAFKPVFHAGGATPLLIVAFCWQIGQMVYPATWAFWCEIRFGWSPHMIGLSLAASGITMALTQVFVTGHVIRRFGEARTVMIGMVVAVITFVAINFATAGWMVFALIALGSLTGLVFPGINALLSRSVDAANQGALQGGMASLGSVAEVIGPLAMTQTLAFGTEHGTPGAAFLLAAALAGVAAVIVATRLVRWERVAPA
ncbi:TCR/Tet family MFS transporter [Sphingomonas sp. NFR15]|uniref:TCR/Tet family MFS transporter n=1 Tax=Sphingomonas sp. NFR15 TaxID=1566282 RepID=UPI000887530C|nr:TCR/Tet family MFS transporter [Sphingomonas sp. NFR15]SDA31517.1 MFS transporter, DHA1 family, tetracycline resistance protein [Sphingomonas sp. NFR15]